MSLSADVLSEEAILKWYSEGQQNKGKGMFLEQMKKFVEWLKNAEEGERNLADERLGFARAKTETLVGVPWNYASS